MAFLTKEALLGASDLVEREVDVPSIGGKVKVHSLSAAYSSQASSEALELTTGRRGEQTARVDTVKLEELQVFHALIEPKLDSIEEARTFMQRCGPAAKEIVRVIDEISGVDKQALEEAEATFPAERASANGADVGDAAGTGPGRPDVRARAGA